MQDMQDIQFKEKEEFPKAFMLHTSAVLRIYEWLYGPIFFLHFLFYFPVHTSVVRYFSEEKNGQAKHDGIYALP